MLAIVYELALTGLLIGGMASLTLGVVVAVFRGVTSL